MDYKFILTFVVNVVGLGFTAYQVRLMKQQMANVPARGARKIAFEKQLSKKLYTPVFLMVGLVLLSWIPFVIGNPQSSGLPIFTIGWSGAMDGCNGAIDTSSFVKAADKYRMFLACRIIDPTVDPMEDDKIAVSKPFQITGGIVTILISYSPSAPIRAVAKEGTQTNVLVFLLPRGEDGSRVTRLSDISREGGQILTPGAKLKD